MASAPVAAQRLKPASLARLLGVSRQAIADLARRNIIAVDAEGLIDVELARHAIANRVRPSGKSAANIASTMPEPSAPPPSPTAPTEATQSAAHAQMSYHVAKTLREATEASIAQLKLAQLKSQLIEREPAVQAAFTAFRALRDNLSYLPRHLAAKLAPMTTPHEIELAIAAALRESLDSYATKTLPKLARQLGHTEATAP